MAGASAPGDRRARPVAGRAVALRTSRRSAADGDGVQGGVAPDPAGAVDPAPRVARYGISRLQDSGGRARLRQSHLFPSHAAVVAGAGSFRPLALHRGERARPAQIPVSALWRGRAYVPGTALRLHAGEGFRLSFLLDDRGVGRAGLQAGLAAMADPEAARR